MDSRRNFLGKVASGIGTLAAVPAQVLGANDRVRVGFIGFGDRATELLNHLRACPNTEAVAFSDVFTKQLERAKGLVPGAATFLDHRRMLEDKSIDAVVIATPQHLHALHFVAAIQAGKDIYQEKTMAFNPSHARRMRDALCGSGRVVQIGMQMNSGQGIQKLDSDLSANHRVGADAESETA